MAQSKWVLPAPELPMAMRLAPASSQSPAASASIRFRGTFGRALKSKVASVLPPGRWEALRWRWMRRVSRSANSHSARAARKRAAGQPSLSACGAEALPAPGEAGQAQRCEHARQRVDVDLPGGHARASSSASKLASAVSATGTSAGRPRLRGSSRARRARASGARPSARSSAIRWASCGLAALVVGEREEAHHAPTGVLLGQRLGQARPGLGVLGAREQAVAEDRAGERLRLAPKGMDHVAVVDHVDAPSAACGRRRGWVTTRVAPSQASMRSSYTWMRKRWPMSRAGAL